MKNLIDVPVHTINSNVYRKPNKIKASMICTLAIFLFGAYGTATAGDTLTPEPTSTDVVVVPQAGNEVNISLSTDDSIIPVGAIITEPEPEPTQLPVHQIYANESEVKDNIPSMPTPPRISSGFGIRKHPISGKIKPHRGIDLPFPMGTPILAPASGIVIFAGWKNGFGNVVEIDHGNGYETLFAHNSINLVHTGEYVTITTTIARVGATGWATGPHIHFEVHFNGNILNPLKFLRK